MPAKNRGKILLTAVVALFLMLFLAMRSTSINHQIIVDFPLDMVTQQFRNPYQLAKWYFEPGCDSCAGFSYAKIEQGMQVTDGSHTVRIKEKNPATFQLESGDKSNEPMLFTLKTVNANAQQTALQVQVKCRSWQKWMNMLPKSNVFSKLELFLQNSEALYGYTINVSLIADTTFLFKSIKVSDKERTSSANALFDSLISYATKRQLDYRGNRIFHLEKEDKDSVKLFASISIHTWLPEKPVGGIRFKQMPYRNKLLEAGYKGSFSGLQNVYNAMDDYRRDHNLVNIALPYIKFNTAAINVDDSAIIDVQVYCPVYGGE
jgi:hypothetical protein